MDQTADFADIDSARRIVQERYPDAHRIEFIEHGYDYIVALVDTDYAVRFPRNKEAYIRSQYEKRILAQLQSIDGVKVPVVLDEHARPHYLITSYVPGHHLSPETIRNFTRQRQQAFGEAVARFAYSFHRAISADDERQFRDTARLGDQFEETWAFYFERVVAHGTFASDVQTKIADEYYTKWKAFEESDQPRVVIHDDLHTDNMLFEDDTLVGVIDFASASIGTAEQEFRQLYRINETVLIAAVEMYERLSGRRIDIEAIKTWAIMRELGAYVRRMNAHEMHHAGFVRSCECLDKWLPAGNWSEAAKSA